MSILFLCVEVFLARIIDVSLGTFRTVIVVKGKNLIGSIIGFFEVLIWFLVVDQVLSNGNTNIYVIIAYCLGFATGTYLGGIFSKKFIKTKYEVQVVTEVEINKIVKSIRNAGYAVSVLKLENKNKHLLFIEVDSYNFFKLRHLIKQIDCKAFIIVNETIMVHNGYFGLNK